MRCPYCGNQVPDTARACGHCGQWLVAQPGAPHAVEAPPRRAPPGWVWGFVGGIVVIALVAGVLLAAGVIRLPDHQAVAPPVTSAPMATPTSPPHPTLPPTAPAVAETPTPELVPTPTADLVLTPTPGALLYDDFGDPASGWPVFGDDLGGRVGYGDDVFRIAFSQPCPGFHAAWSPEQYADFTAEISFSVPEGPPEVGAGLTLRTTSKGWYLVWIYPESGEYSFAKDVNENPTDLVRRTHSSTIRPTREDGRLHLQLKVEAYGDTFEIGVATPGGAYERLTTVVDAELQKGHLGPSAPCPDAAFSDPVEILFDWICVSP